MKKVFIQESLEEVVTLSKEHTHHVLHVLRHGTSKPLAIANDSEGHAFYTWIATEEEGTSLWKRQGDVTSPAMKRPIILVQAFLKGEKFEWVLQKTTELDVTAVLGVASKNCVAKYEPKKLATKEQRWKKIQNEASQQCGRQQRPDYRSFTTWHAVHDYILEQYPLAVRWIAYENEEQRTLKDLLREANQSDIKMQIPWVIAIGPEGGFAPEEVQALEEQGWVCVSLGDTILRAETAAVAAISILNYERG